VPPLILDQLAESLQFPPADETQYRFESSMANVQLLLLPEFKLAQAVMVMPGLALEELTSTKLTACVLVLFKYHCAEEDVDRNTTG
jgi:hypothetical protein